MATSPYFQSSGLRRSTRKSNAVAATVLTAMASASVLPIVEGFSPKPSIPSSTSILAKRNAAAVTPSPLQKKSRKTSAPSKNKPAPLTNSFEALWCKDTSVHTLILGTHRSIKSLDRAQYYGHPMNAFWWIAGDCLEFRRDRGVSDSTGKPYKFAQDLRHDSELIIPYTEQVERLTSSGFALWDVIASCERPGSLDQDIRSEAPNAIREFCQQHRGSLRRIVFSNGGTGSKLFVKHFRDWLESGELDALPNHEASQKAFANAIERGDKKRAKSGETDSVGDEDKIQLICAVGVSPANARFSYAEKRNEWDQYVYQPGLRDHQKN